MKNIIKFSAVLLSLGVASFISSAKSAVEPKTWESKYKEIILRDFRSVRDGKCVNFNLGTTAHGPATLNVLQKYLPKDVHITIWASYPLDDELKAMMDRRFPDIEIVSGSYKDPSKASPELRKAIERSDLFLVSSGSGISVVPSLKEYLKWTGKPVAAYAIGYNPVNDSLFKKMDFVMFRDELAVEKAAQKPSTPKLSGYAPDAVFDFDCVDENGASEFIRNNGLKSGRFICCIPGYRHTPGWEFFGGKPDKKKDAKNQAFKDSDNSIIRETIIEAVRTYKVKVVILAENFPEVRLGKEILLEKLPEDVRKECVYVDHLMPPDLALGIYKKSLCVCGLEMHSQVMAVGNGIPAVILRHKGFGSKSDMFNTVGLGDWVFDIDGLEGYKPGSGFKDAVLDILKDRKNARRKLQNAREIIDKASKEAVESVFMK